MIYYVQSVTERGHLLIQACSNSEQPTAVNIRCKRHYHKTGFESPKNLLRSTCHAKYTNLSEPSGFFQVFTGYWDYTNITFDFFGLDNGVVNRAWSLKRETAFLLWPCHMPMSTDSREIIGGARAISNKPVGVISGHCSNIKDNLLLEMMLPDIDNKKFVYISFCMKNYTCSVQIYNAFECNVTVYKEGEMEQNSKTYSIKFMTVETYAVIESNFALHVNVYVRIKDARNMSEGILTSCIVVPAHLFLTEYSWRVPNEATNNKVIVVILGTPFTTLETKLKRLNSKKDYILWHLATLKNSTDTPKSIYQMDLPENSPNQFSLFIGLVETFGCYASGQINSIFLVPVGMQEYVYMPNSAHRNVTKATPKSTTTTTSSAAKAPTTFTTTTLTTSPCPCIKTPMKEGDRLDNDCDGYIDEEMNNNKDDDDDGITDEDVADVTENGCLPGWFGTYCDKMCRCQDSKCKPDGECWENVTCLYGYFGAQCQYKDAIANAAVSHAEMRHRTPSKCTLNYAAVSPLTITFDKKLIFSWIQIEAISKENLSGLSIVFAPFPKDGSCYTGRCANRRDFYADNNTLIIYCSLQAVVCKMLIVFDETKGIRRFCAVYVSQGRNIALRKHTSMSSYFNDSRGFLSRGSLSVDGHVGKSLTSCSRTKLGDVNSTWTISFRKPVVLNAIFINFDADEHSKKISVEVLGEGNKSVKSFHLLVNDVASLTFETQFTALNVRVSKENNGKPLIICELEAYGECVPPHHGPDCEDICSITCIDQVCSYEGYCRQCSNGTGGPYCFEGCLDWCEEYVEPTQTTIGTPTPPSGAPYHRQSGFVMENFWYYFLMVFILLLVVCCSGLEFLAARPKKKQFEVEEDNIVRRSTPDFTSVSKSYTTVLHSSTSVDVSKSVKTVTDITSAESH